MTIGDRIKQRREAMNLSQEELAKRLGYKSRSSINKIERDASGLPQQKIAAIASALETTPAYIMGWEEKVTEEMHEKNDIAVDIVIRLGRDKDFAELVKLLYKLDASQIASIKAMLSGFVK